MRVLPVMVAMGMDHRGIMAGKSVVTVNSCVKELKFIYAILTERTYSSHNPQWLPIISRLHILRNLQHLSSQLSGNSTSRLRNLQAPQHITLRIGKRLSLLQRNARS